MLLYVLWFGCCLLLLLLLLFVGFLVYAGGSLHELLWLSRLLTITWISLLMMSLLLACLFVCLLACLLTCPHTVRAEIITELILKRAGPVIFKTFLLELIAFRPIPVICPARGVKPENYWKR